MAEDLTQCDVNFIIPPKDIKYGALEMKRQAAIAAEDPFEPKRTKRESKAFPKNPPPKGLQFPFLEESESADRIVYAASHVRRGAGNVLGPRKIGHQKAIFPGWLIQLDDSKLSAIMDIKNTLKSGKKICDIVDPLCTAVDELGAGVTREEIIEVIRRTPAGESGWSFPHFMLTVGCPHLAREKDILQAPIPYSENECTTDERGDKQENVKKLSESESQKETTNRLYQPYKYEKEDTWPYTDDDPQQNVKHKKKKKTSEDSNIDLTGYTPREKIFFSGLLIFEMYHTIHQIEELYFQSDNIPIPKEKALKKQMRRGFGVENAGTKKIGFAEWDRPLPPIPKKSPYVSNLPFVATRWKITEPNNEESTKRRTLTTLQPLHLMVNAPPKPKDKIRITENQMRIKKAMEYLASTGNCVAMLPNAHCIVHLSDTFLQKLEEINMHATHYPTPPKILPNNDLAWILRQAKDLFLPHGLPPQIANMDFLVKFTDAVCLRKICEHVRSQHWKYICERKVDFRLKAWKLMHVERIPCGQLRDNFVYAFNTYLPYVSYLPIVHNNTAMPW